MSRAWKRRLGGVALSGLLVFLAFAAAGCGGGAAAARQQREQISGLGSSRDDIQQKARRRGAGQPRHLVRLRGPVVGEAVHAADGLQGEHEGRRELGRHDRLLSTGQYDGVSASGNASVRLMSRGDVAPINTDYIPNFGGRPGGDQVPVVNSRDGKPYGVPHGRGPNLLMFRTDSVPQDTNSWAVIWDKSAPYNGKLSIYDDSIFIADAAVYLKATRPT